MEQAFTPELACPTCLPGWLALPSFVCLASCFASAPATAASTVQPGCIASKYTILQLVIPCTLSPQPMCCRMPASSTMAAPFGRITSGRGFAPNGHEAHDLPAAGQFIWDHADFNGKITAEAWLQQAKMLKSLQGMQRHASPNQIPSAMLGQCHSRPQHYPSSTPALPQQYHTEHPLAPCRSCGAAPPVTPSMAWGNSHVPFLSHCSWCC